jgi:hypothetical protein
VAVTAAALAAVAPALPAVTADAGGNGSFGITPAPAGNGSAPAYFIMTVAAGDSAPAQAIISNNGQTTGTLKVSRSSGATAGNGGSSFSRSFHSCAGVGCWVSGLPATLTLPGGSRERVPFTVRVPARTAPGQYLAGITVESAAQPQPVQVGANGAARAQAIVIQQVTVGIAVTVGSLTDLKTRFRISGVSGAAIGPTPRLTIRLHNTGQTFAHAAGRASCSDAGRRHSYAVIADTILPHDQAMIAVNAPGLPAGTMPCLVRLLYGNGQQVRWAGQVTIPAPPHARIVHTAKGVYSVIPQATFPPWAMALLMLGGLLLAAVAVLLFRMRKRRLAT